MIEKQSRPVVEGRGEKPDTGKPLPTGQVPSRQVRIETAINQIFPGASRAQVAQMQEFIWDQMDEARKDAVHDLVDLQLNHGES